MHSSVVVVWVCGVLALLCVGTAQTVESRPPDSFLDTSSSTNSPLDASPYSSVAEACTGVMPPNATHCVLPPGVIIKIPYNSKGINDVIPVPLTMIGTVIHMSIMSGTEEGAVYNWTLNVAGPLAITNNTQIFPVSVILNATTLYMDETSFIDASNTAPTVFNDKSQGVGGAGGGNGGAGSPCSNKVGYGDSQPFGWNYGGCAILTGDANGVSRGGGRILLTANTLVHVDGNLTSNGEQSISHYRGGGAGGSIWLQAPTVNVTNALLSVRGGNAPLGSARGEGTGGGSGGIVAIDAATVLPSTDPASFPGLDLNGGSPSADECSIASPGLMYLAATKQLACVSDQANWNKVMQTQWVSPQESSTQMLPEIVSLYMTSCYWDVSSVTGPAQPLAAVSIIGSALDVPAGATNPFSVNGTLAVAKGSSLTCLRCANGAELVIDVVSLQLIESIIISGRLHVRALESVYIGRQAYVHFGGPTVIETKNLQILNDLSQSDIPAEPPSLLLMCETLVTGLSSDIFVEKLVIVANQSAELAGSIQIRSSTTFDCTAPLATNVTCGDHRVLLDDAYQLEMFTNQFTLRRGGGLRGPALRLCANVTNIVGTIDTSGYGCAAMTGAGAGQSNKGAPGSGGGHGGPGGDGVLDGQPQSEWSAPGPANDDAQYPALMGSGGGGSVLGGGGGGLVYLESVSIVVNGSILANGADGGAESVSMSPALTSTSSSGGGAGGTIILMADELLGSTGALIAANGGDGAYGGGGGGGGGIIKFTRHQDSHQLEQNLDDLPIVAYLGHMSNQGGAGDFQACAGGTGESCSDPPCQPGQGGALCLDCDVGYFQEHQSANAVCQPCQPGRFSGSPRSTGCVSCGDDSLPRSYQPQWHQSACMQCHRSRVPTNNYQECGLCGEGFGVPPELTNKTDAKCFQCEQGKFSGVPGLEPCQDCPVGTYSKSDTPPTACTACAANSFANSSASARCDACPAGRVTDGPPPYVQCVTCPAGFERPDEPMGVFSVPLLDDELNDFEGVLEEDQEEDRQEEDRQEEDQEEDQLQKRDAETSDAVDGFGPAPSLCKPCFMGSVSLAGEPCHPCNPGERPSHVQTTCEPCPYHPGRGNWSNTVQKPGGGRCHFVCAAGYDADPELCLSAVELAVHPFGGWLVFGSVLGLLTVCLLLYTTTAGASYHESQPCCACLRSSGRKPRRKDTLGEGAMSVPLTLSTYGSGSTPAPARAPSGGLVADAAAMGYASLDWFESSSKTRRKSGSRVGMHHATTTSADLSRLLHRVYLVGYNTAQQPMQLPTTVPPELVPVVHREEYEEFALDVTNVTRWASWEVRLWWVLWLYYPLAVMWRLIAQEWRVRRLWRYYEVYDHALLRNTRAQALGDCIKFGTSQDKTLAWFDVLVSSTDDDVGGVPVGHPRLPAVLFCSGNGSYLSPYRLELSDPVVIANMQMLGESWRDVVVGLNDMLRLFRPGPLERQAAVRQVQAYLSLVHDSIDSELVVHLGVSHATPDETPASRLVVMLLSPHAAPEEDGRLPYYVPHEARLLRWRTRTRRLFQTETGSSVLGLMFRNSPKMGNSTALACMLVLFLMMDLALAILVSSGMWSLRRDMFWLMTLVLPLTWIAALAVGFAAVILRRATLYRVHMILNLMSLPNALIVLIYGAVSLAGRYGDRLFLVCPILWVFTKLLMGPTSNLQIAHIEFQHDTALLESVRDTKTLRVNVGPTIDETKEDAGDAESLSSGGSAQEHIRNL